MEISREAALASVQNKNAVEDPTDTSSQSLELEERSVMFALRAEERKNIIGMRKEWSRWILRCIVFIVGVDVIVMFLLGFHALSFDNQWFVPTFIADSLAKVLGLALIIVGFLFGKDSVDGGSTTNP